MKKKEKDLVKQQKKEIHRTARVELGQGAIWEFKVFYLFPALLDTIPGADAAKASASFPVKKAPLGAGPLGRSVDTGIMGYAPATAPGHTRSLSGGKVDLGELLR